MVRSDTDSIYGTQEVQVIRYIVHIINSIKYGLVITAVIMIAVIDNPLKTTLDGYNPELLIPLGIVLAGLLVWLVYLIHITPRRRLCPNQ